MDDDGSELLRLEHAGWESLCDGTGARYYGDAMTPDGVMVLADGSTLDRAAVIASLEHAPTWDHYEIADERVIPLGPDAAALVYTGKATRSSGPPFVATMSSVYVRHHGVWHLAVYQQTPEVMPD